VQWRHVLRVSQAKVKVWVLDEQRLHARRVALLRELVDRGLGEVSLNSLLSIATSG
jgi:hypothetical protein